MTGPEDHDGLPSLLHAAATWHAKRAGQGDPEKARQHLLAAGEAIRLLQEIAGVRQEGLASASIASGVEEALRRALNDRVSSKPASPQETAQAEQGYGVWTVDSEPGGEARSDGGSWSIHNESGSIVLYGDWSSDGQWWTSPDGDRFTFPGVDSVRVVNGPPPSTK